MEFHLMPNHIQTHWVYAPRIMNYDELVTPGLLGRHFCFRCKSHPFAYTQPVQLQIEGKAKYPDFLLCGHWPLFLISDDVALALEENHINGYVLHPTTIIPAANNTHPPKQYHALEVTRHIPLDFNAMGVKVLAHCNKCNQAQYDKQTWQFGEAQYEPPEYTSSFFTFQYFPCGVCCTYDVALLLAQKQFKGLRITDAKYNFTSAVQLPKPYTYKMLRDLDQ